MTLNPDATASEIIAALTERYVRLLEVNQTATRLDGEIRQLEERLCHVIGGHEFRPTGEIHLHSGQTLMRCRKCDKTEYQ